MLHRGSTRPALARLDPGNRFVHAAVRAMATEAAMPAPPVKAGWIERAGQHGVLSVLAVHLQPTDDNDYLRAVRWRMAADRLRTMVDLRSVQCVLGEAGIEWLIFKGPVVSELVYQRSGTRDYSDVDILVRPDCFAAAVDALTSRGARTGAGESLAVMRQMGRGELGLVLQNGTTLDLHWDVINKADIRHRFSISAGLLLARSKDIQLDGISLRTFDDVDTILHLALHGCLSGGDKLRFLLDLHQGLKRIKPAESELRSRAGMYGLELVLRLMENRMATFVDESVALELSRPSVAERSWLAADAIAMKCFPPGSRFEGKSSGGTISLSTRESSWASWRSFVENAPAAAWPPRHDG